MNSWVHLRAALVCILTLVTGSFAQTPVLSKEYIRLGGRVIAIEVPGISVAKSEVGLSGRPTGVSEQVAVSASAPWSAAVGATDSSWLSATNTGNGRVMITARNGNIGQSYVANVNITAPNLPTKTIKVTYVPTNKNVIRVKDSSGVVISGMTFNSKAASQVVTVEEASGAQFNFHLATTGILHATSTSSSSAVDGSYPPPASVTTSVALSTAPVGISTETLTITDTGPSETRADPLTIQAKINVGVPHIKATADACSSQAPNCVSLTTNGVYVAANYGQANLTWPNLADIVVINDGDGTLNWAVSATVFTEPSNLGNIPWLSAAAVNGLDSNGVTIPLGLSGSKVRLTAQPGTLTPGDFHGIITITDRSGLAQSRIIPVTMTIGTPQMVYWTYGPNTGLGSTCSGQGNGAATSIDATAYQGGSTPGWYVMICNLAGGTPGWSATVNNGTANQVTWLTVSPTSVPLAAHSPQYDILFVTLNPAAALAPGAYHGTVVLAATDNNMPRSLPVNLTVNAPPTMAMTPTAPMAFVASSSGNPPPQPILVTKGGPGTLNWNATVTSGSSWLTLSDSSGPVTTVNGVNTGGFNVVPKVAGITGGDLTGTILVNAPGVPNATQTMTVKMRLVAVSSTSLHYYASGGTQTFSITGPSISPLISWTSTITPGPGCPANPLSFSAPAPWVNTIATVAAPPLPQGAPACITNIRITPNDQTISPSEPPIDITVTQDAWVPSTGPTIAVLNQAFDSSATQMVDVMVLDNNGPNAITTVAFLINHLQTTYNSCLMMYSPQTNQFSFITNGVATNVILGQHIPNSSTDVLSNVHCSLDVFASSIGWHEGTEPRSFMMHLKLTMQPAAVGLQTIWAYGLDNAVTTPTWVQKQTWNPYPVSNTAPTVAFQTPPTQASNFTLPLTIADVNGYLFVNGIQGSIGDVSGNANTYGCSFSITAQGVLTLTNYENGSVIAAGTMNLPAQPASSGPSVGDSVACMLLTPSTGLAGSNTQLGLTLNFTLGFGAGMFGNLPVSVTVTDQDGRTGSAQATWPRLRFTVSPTALHYYGGGGSYQSATVNGTTGIRWDATLTDTAGNPFTGNWVSIACSGTPCWGQNGYTGAMAVTPNVTPNTGSSSRSARVKIVQRDDGQVAWFDINQDGWSSTGSPSASLQNSLTNGSLPSSSPQTLLFRFDDPNGPGAIQTVSFLVNNSSLPTGNSCYAAYYPVANAFHVNPYPGQTPYPNQWWPYIGNGGGFASTHCQVLAQASISYSGTGITLSLPVVLQPSAVGTQQVYAWTTNTSGVSSSQTTSLANWSVYSLPSSGSPGAFTDANSAPGYDKELIHHRFYSANGYQFIGKVVAQLRSANGSTVLCTLTIDPALRAPTNFVVSTVTGSSGCSATVQAHAYADPNQAPPDPNASGSSWPYLYLDVLWTANSDVDPALTQPLSEYATVTDASGNQATTSLSSSSWISTGPPVVTSAYGSASGGLASYSDSANILQGMSYTWTSDVGSCGVIYDSSSSYPYSSTCPGGGYSFTPFSSGYISGGPAASGSCWVHTWSTAWDSGGHSVSVDFWNGDDPSCPPSMSPQSVRRRADVDGGIAAVTANNAPGSISGKILDAAGKPVVGATIHTSRMAPAKQSDFKQFDYVQTASDGSFKLAGLIQDKSHKVCVEVNEQGYLNPCIWDGNAPSVNVAPGQLDVSNLTVNLVKGGTLKVLINDPNHLLDSTEAKNKWRMSVLAVAAKGFSLVQPSSLVKSPAGREYDLLVPLDTAVKVRILNQHFDLKDANGKVWKDTLMDLAAKYNSGGKNDPIVLTVVGVH